VWQKQGPVRPEKDPERHEQQRQRRACAQRERHQQQRGQRHKQVERQLAQQRQGAATAKPTGEAGEVGAQPQRVAQRHRGQAETQQSEKHDSPALRGRPRALSPARPPLRAYAPGPPSREGMTNPVHFPMNTVIFIWFVYALWLILIVYLTVAGLGAKRDTHPHMGQSFGLLFAMIAAFALPHVPILSFVNFAPVNPALSIVGLILCVAGMAVLVSARQHLGRNWSQTVSAKEGHELVTSGPYRYVRHPMYAGGLLACLGSAIV